MTKTNDLKKKLAYGDYKIIAEITEFSYDYVRKVLEGKRKNQTIIDVAARLIESKASIKKDMIDSKESSKQD